MRCDVKKLLLILVLCFSSMIQSDEGHGPSDEKRIKSGRGLLFRLSYTQPATYPPFKEDDRADVLRSIVNPKKSALDVSKGRKILLFLINNKQYIASNLENDSFAEYVYNLFYYDHPQLLNPEGSESDNECFSRMIIDTENDSRLPLTNLNFKDIVVPKVAPEIAPRAVVQPVSMESIVPQAIPAELREIFIDEHKDTLHLYEQLMKTNDDYFKKMYTVGIKKRQEKLSEDAKKFLAGYLEEKGINYIE